MRTPKEIVQFINKGAEAKENTPLKKLILGGIIAGAYIAIGALLSVIVGYGMPGISEGNPAIIKLLAGATFPIGLILITIAGGDLFTGCCAIFIPNAMNKKQRWIVPIKICTIVWITNFIGALLVAYLMVYLPEISHQEPALNGFITIAKAKTANPFYVTFLKGIGANWLVCLAIWLGASSKTISGKILGLWIPVMAFVAIGYEHSIANMFFLPVAMMEGFDLSISEMFTNNLIPATLGNIIGGALLVGGVYWYIYDRK